MSASESHSAAVLQLAEEFLERYRQGQRPSLKEYIDRHPELAAEIKDVFPAVALMENVALGEESLAGAATGPHTPSDATPPQQLGDYRILREVGRGGMGIVYEAEQISLGRHVALKVLPRKVLLDDAQKRRFEREAKAAAKLHHTNIVPVYGVGEHDGLPYYVMQFIQGLGLDAVLKELKNKPCSGTPAAAVARSLLTGTFHGCERGRVSPPNEPAAQPALGALTRPRSPDSSATADAITLSTSSVVLPGGKGKKATYWQSVAQIGVQVAEALEHAHKQGIVHRDIKPSNLLLDTAGTVWVMDFGLARADDDDHLTNTGDVVGTLRYMPPEAFEGHGDKRGDIYSLGLTLYELLARQPAFEERDRHRLIKRVTTEEAARLDKLQHAIPRDLVTIVHKAIDREPGRRYQTADDFSADLQRFLDDEPIRARRVSNAERLLRWSRRNKGLAVLSATALLLLVTVAVVSTLSIVQLLAKQQRINEAERKALTGQVNSLLTASPANMPSLLDSLKLRADEVLQVLEESERLGTLDFVPRLRLNVALAVLGRDRRRQLCEAAADTPPAESFNLLRGLKSSDKSDGGKTVEELSMRYQQAKDGEGRTRLAIALLELDHPFAACRELALQPNLTARDRFIHLFATWHGDLSAVLKWLRETDDNDLRSGLCLSAANVDLAQLPASTLHALNDLFKQLYTSAPEGGTHGAAEYALRHRGLPLPPIAPTQGPIKGRRWFINRQGMTLIAVEPGWFHPRSSERRAGPDGLPPQTVMMTRPFFMGDQEVTSEWYRRYLKSADHPKGEELTDATQQGDLRYELALVRRPSAILFCNWLSRAEGRKQCYGPGGRGRGMVCDFTANGYRLPTDAEWEHAFRCGTTTRYFVGDDAMRMLEYGRVVLADEPGAGKCFFPNPNGLFDMLGNGWEMCWDQGINQFVDDGLKLDPVGPVGPRFAMRGGSADAGFYYLHSSARFSNSDDSNLAFRVVCGPPNVEDAKDDEAMTFSVLNRFLKRYVNSAPPLWARGEWYAQHRRWKEAADDFTLAVQCQPPNDALSWLRVAPALAAAGDHEGYRRLCRDMLIRFGQTRNPLKAERIAKACLLLPMTAKEMVEACQLAERSIALGKNVAWKHNFVSFVFCKGLADYRRENFRAAVEELDPLLSKIASTPDLSAMCHLVLAMACQRQGQTNAAHEHLTKGAMLLDRNVSESARFPSYGPQQYHHDWLIVWLLHYEARTLIEGKATTPNK